MILSMYRNQVRHTSEDNHIGGGSVTNVPLLRFSSSGIANEKTGVSSHEPI